MSRKCDGKRFDFVYLLSWITRNMCSVPVFYPTARQEGKATMNIGKVLAASAAINSQKTAIALGQEAISYQELDQSVTILAQWLVQQGYQRGDRIVLLWPNSIELVMLFFACYRAGLIAVPVDVRMKTSEVAYVLEHSRADLSFVLREVHGMTEDWGRDREPGQAHSCGLSGQAS
jgi:acyl-CoA synthetase (AMP-forming)/AMP-acid ligase II